MPKLTCLIVDDEPLALDLIESYVQQTPFLKLAGRCENVFEAIDLINSTNIDLVFLDIQMPGFNGIEFSKTISKRQRIIFTTAFEKYALEGFKVDALDFLLKPFNYEEFFKAASKAKIWYELTGTNLQPLQMPDHIFVKSEYKQIRVALKDILYIEGQKDYVRIWVEHELQPIMSLASLMSFEEEILPPSLFMRVHRSYIISLNKIEFIERNQIVVNGTRINIGDPYKDKFQRYLSGQPY